MSGKAAKLIKKSRWIVLIAVLACTGVMLLPCTVLAKQNIRLNHNKRILTVGEKETLNLEGISGKKKSTVTWKSSDKSVVSVNKNGRMTARKKGKTAGAVCGSPDVQLSVGRDIQTADQGPDAGVFCDWQGR